MRSWPGVDQWLVLIDVAPAPVDRTNPHDGMLRRKDAEVHGAAILQRLELDGCWPPERVVAHLAVLNGPYHWQREARTIAFFVPACRLAELGVRLGMAQRVHCGFTLLRCSSSYLTSSADSASSTSFKKMSLPWPMTQMLRRFSSVTRCTKDFTSASVITAPVPFGSSL